MVKGSKPFGPIIILTKLFIPTKLFNNNEIHQTCIRQSKHKTQL
jgi:hypothetical protein